MILPFTLQQLRILKAISIEKNFSKAATTLYLSQPSLSKQIKTLEKNLDILLVNRDHSQISLTESGKVLLHYAERILALCEESYRALVDIKTGDRGNLTVGASQTIGTYLMPKILVLFAQNYPQIGLKVQVNSTRLIAKSIIKQEVDIAVVGGEISEELAKNIKIHPFIYDELILIVSNSHPFAKKQRIHKKDLYCLDFITLNSNSTIKKFIDKTLSQNQIDPNHLKIVLQLNSIEAIKTAVSLGLGCAFISSSAIEKELNLQMVKIIRIKNIKINRKLSVISNPKCYKSKAFKLFLTELTKLKTNIKN